MVNTLDPDDDLIRGLANLPHLFEYEKDPLVLRAGEEGLYAANRFTRVPNLSTDAFIRILVGALTEDGIRRGATR